MAAKIVAKQEKARPRKKVAIKPRDEIPEPPLKLRIEKVPQPIWKMNLRHETLGLGKHRWDKLRKTIIEDKGAVCAICGDTEKPRAHEVWEYREADKGPSTARLVNIEIICDRCHYVHHWGMTLELLAGGHIGQDTIAGLEAHFRRVNGCTEADFRRHVLVTSAEHQRRSAKKWNVDWGDFAPMVADAIASRASRRPK